MEIGIQSVKLLLLRKELKKAGQLDAVKLDPMLVSNAEGTVTAAELVDDDDAAVATVIAVDDAAADVVVVDAAAAAVSVVAAASSRR